jgi:multidrug efflux pump subunit AcrA (membrane-fusion protein)
MRRIVLALGGLGLVLVLSPLRAQEIKRLEADPKLPKLVVQLAPQEEAQVPAQEAGVLMKILVKEGDEVTAGKLLAQIDDAIPRAQQDVAEFKLKAANQQANDDIDIRFATASAEVAKAEYKQALESNRQVPGSVTQSELLRRALEWEKMKLSIEKASKDHEVALWQAQVAKAELRAATVNVERRKVTAPLDAVVVELSQHVGQWVQMGEPVMRLVRIDQLRVNGVLNAEEYRPSDIQNRPVSIEVKIPHGKPRKFLGRIVYVKPVIEGGTLQVRADVKNERDENGVWILYPGMSAEMTIELK